MRFTLICFVASTRFATVCYTPAMASIYTRKTSPVFWIRFKDDDGKWRGKATGYRLDNPGDRRQAELLARRVTTEEQTRRPLTGGEAWEAWVPKWLAEKYGQRANHTHTVYSRHWRHLAEWFAEVGLRQASQVRYGHLLEYRDSRLEDGIGINTIIQEVKLLGIVMQEACRREYAQGNPCARLGWKREKAAEKVEWSDAEYRAVFAKLREEGPEWMLVTLILGFHQAARLRQCAVLISDIDFPRLRITYRKTKGDKPFTQPLDRRAVPVLSEIVANRQKQGFRTLCDLPEMPSVEWRRVLDDLKFPHLCHHGLRVTWITRAARSGKIPEPQARRFVNHASGTVHQLYQKLNADDVSHLPDALDLPSPSDH